MNLIEKLIEDTIKELESDYLLYSRAYEINSDDRYAKKQADECSTRLTDLRNALQEYREMCKRDYRANPSSPISPLNNPD